MKFLSAKAIASFDTRALRSEYNRFYHKGNKDWWKTIFQIIRPILSGNSRVQQGIGLPALHFKVSLLLQLEHSSGQNTGTGTSKIQKLFKF